MKEYYTREEILNIIDLEIKETRKFMENYIELNGGNEVVHRFDASICALASLYYKF